MHDQIIRFSMPGEMKGANKVEERERHIRFLENHMRNHGCVPVLDLIPQFTVNYLPETETYEFRVSVYGVFVGMEEAWYIDGMTNGTTTTSSTQKHKSKPSSDTVA
jgi:hypothetical protein